MGIFALALTVITPHSVPITSNRQVKDRTIFLRYLRNVNERWLSQALAFAGIIGRCPLVFVKFESSAVELLDL
jgi:hypothetical protein